MKKGCLTASVVALVCALGLAFLVWDFARIKDWGIGEESVNWLPASASNINYIYGSINQIAEFDIDRNSFEDWCISIEKPLKPIPKGQENSIHRANNKLAKLGAIEKPSKKSFSSVWDYYKWYDMKFTDGDLFYDELWSNGGGYSIGYDVSEGRGYYLFMHH